jgi:hypothetical protein
VVVKEEMIFKGRSPAGPGCPLFPVRATGHDASRDVHRRGAQRDCVRHDAYLPAHVTRAQLEDDMADDSKDQIQISVRMPADLVSALERRAEEEDRTLSAEIRRIARRALLEEAA